MFRGTRAGADAAIRSKLLHQFNHRWATYDGKDARDALPMELADPASTVRPRYWVEQRQVEARLRDC